MRVIIICLIMAIFAGCKESSKSNPDTKDTVKTNPQMPADTLSNTKDTVFHGLGTEPFWSVYVISNDKIIFNNADGANVVVPYVAPVTIDDVTTKYTSANDSTNMELLIKKQDCSDGMSEKTYPYAMTISINALKFKGCGESKTAN